MKEHDDDGKNRAERTSYVYICSRCRLEIALQEEHPLLGIENDELLKDSSTCRYFKKRSRIPDGILPHYTQRYCVLSL